MAGKLIPYCWLILIHSHVLVGFLLGAVVMVDASHVDVGGPFVSEETAVAVPARAQHLSHPVITTSASRLGAMGQEKEREEKEEEKQEEKEEGKKKEREEERYECKCNMPALITIGVAVSIIVIGVILCVVGVVQASEMIAKTVIIDGQTEFSLLVPPSEIGDTYETRHERRIWAFYTENPNVEPQDLGTKCYGFNLPIYQAVDALARDWWDQLRGWERDECGRHTRTYAGHDLMLIGYLGRSYSGGTAFFSVDFPVWVVDASVDLDDLQMPFEVAGLTAAGVVVVSIGTIVSFVACYLMRRKKTTTPVPVPDPAEQPVEVIAQPDAV